MTAVFVKIHFFRSRCDLHTPLLSLRLFILLTIRTICLNLIGPMWTSSPLIGRKGDNLAFKFHYRTCMRLSKILTGHEFGSKKFLPDKNLALKYHYQTSYQQKKKKLNEIVTENILSSILQHHDLVHGSCLFLTASLIVPNKQLNLYNRYIIVQIYCIDPFEYDLCTNLFDNDFNDASTNKTNLLPTKNHHQININNN